MIFSSMFHELRERERKGDRRGGGCSRSSTYPNIMFVLYIIAQPTSKKLSGGQLGERVL
jgi:hypothetical protein